jgi:hypothetical protein
MTIEVDPFSAEALMMPDELIRTVKVTPRKIIKRRESFVMFPMRWYEVLNRPKMRASVVLMAIYLVHLDWRHRHTPFKLPNGMLGEDRISRWKKYRALDRLEELGLISVERRERRSPIVTVNL